MLLRVYTHPACSGCVEAVQAAWELQQRHPAGLELRTVNLADTEGLREAQAERIQTIPTLIFSEDGLERERIVGMPGRAALAETVNRLLNQGN
jgi:glutaredoxin